MGKKTEKNPRLGTVGGQAVVEGVMMKSKDSIAIAVRRENGEIVKKSKPYTALKDKYKILNVPIIRGFVNFIDMMKLSMSTLTESIEMLDLFEEESEKKEKQKDKKESKSDTSKMTTAASVIGVVLGLALSFALFFYLPTFLSKTLESAVSSTWDIELGSFLSLFEGILKLAIFLIYILLVSQMKDIRRTFEYHGAEHMSIFAYERGEELTVENVRKHSRFHPRCGTSFLIIMILIGVGIGMIIPREYGVLLRVLVRLSLFPAIIGLGFEFLRFAGKHTDNIIVRILSAPGMWVQRLTTKKPSDDQLEVAIISLKAALNLEETTENASGDSVSAVPLNREKAIENE